MLEASNSRTKNQVYSIIVTNCKDENNKISKADFQDEFVEIDNQDEDNVIVDTNFQDKIDTLIGTRSGPFWRFSTGLAKCTCKYCWACNCVRLVMQPMTLFIL